MVFSSSVFIFAFLPAVLAIYFLLKITPLRGLRNFVLLIFSLFFYAWGEPIYVFLMIASIVVNWLAGIVMGQAVDRAETDTEGALPSKSGAHTKPAHAKPAQVKPGNAKPEATEAQKSLHARRRIVLVVTLIIDLGILGFFKYEGFLAENVNALAGTVLIPNLELPLPIGISFFTLQAVSYIIDVYWGKVAPQRKVLNLGMYIAMFPQLIAGPIVRYETIEEQVNNRRENLDDFASGLRLFCIGLAKKVLLANNVAILANSMLAAAPADIGFIGAWGGIVAYSFQIFFDFSGYSDMAIGLGKMFGFKYLRNFNYPYIAKSVTDFWRRWHISLSSVFRDYVYIPLGGSRVSSGRWVFNIAVVWGLTGLWHGAAWNFVLWGLYYGVFLVLEKLVWGKILAKIPRVFRHLYVILIFICGWVFFWISDPAQILAYFQSMAGMNGLTGTMTFWELHAWEYWPLFLICALASTPVVPWMRKLIEKKLAGTGAQVEAVQVEVGQVEVAFAGAPSFATGTREQVEPARAETARVEAAPVKGNDHPPTVALDRGIVQATESRGLVFVVNTVVDLSLLLMLVFSIFAIVSGSYNPFIYFQF